MSSCRWGGRYSRVGLSHPVFDRKMFLYLYISIYSIHRTRQRGDTYAPSTEFGMPSPHADASTAAALHAYSRGCAFVRLMSLWTGEALREEGPVRR